LSVDTSISYTLMETCIKCTDLHQQMFAKNLTHEVCRQGTQHFTLAVEQTTINRT